MKIQSKYVVSRWELKYINIADGLWHVKWVTNSDVKH